MKIAFIILALCTVGFLSAVQRADASLTACNRTSRTISVAYFVWAQGSAPQTKGWWTISPGQCGEIGNLDLADYDHVGYYAVSGDGAWAGDSRKGLSLCIDLSRAFDYTDALGACPTKRVFRVLSIPVDDSSHSFDLTL
jgi:uncharacterized membrane protein